MTRDEAARYAFAELHQTFYDALHALMAKVDARARAEEREACAKVCESLLDEGEDSYVVNRCLVVIRRGQPMNRDDIIRMAQQCWPSGPKDIWAADMHLPRLERFAAFVAAAEREACAKVCEQKSPVKGGEVFAARIRERGATETGV